MHLKFTATFDVEDYKTHNVTRYDNLLLLRYDNEFKDKVRRELRKIVDKNAKNQDKDRPPVELQVDVNIHYSQRSIDQNKWQWAAHTLEANIINGGLAAWKDGNIRWRNAGTITPEQIHDDYMSRFAAVGFVDVESGFVSAVRQMLEETQGHVINEEWIKDINRMRFTVRKSSSYMDVREFCEYAEHITDQILSYGIDINSGVDFKNLMEDLQTIKTGMIEKDASITILTEPKESDIVDKELDIF